MEAGRKQLEQLVQMNFLQHQAQQHLSQHPEIGKTLLEQMSQDNFNNSNQSLNVNLLFYIHLKLLKNVRFNLKHNPSKIFAA
jgi:hypothetical protein